MTQVLTHLDKCVGGGKIGVARKKQVWIHSCSLLTPLLLCRHRDRVKLRASPTIVYLGVF